MLGVQDYIAFAIVALVVFYWVNRIFQAPVRRALSNWLLKKGKVRWAMRVRF